MNWILPALLSPAIYTFVNFIDKYIVSKEVKDYRGMPIYGTIMGFFIGTVFWITTGFPTLSLRDAVIVLITGMITLWAAALYFKAIYLEEASTIILLFQTTPIITLILSFLVLRESITLTQFFGFLLILFATIFVSIERGKTKVKLSEGFVLILVVNLMYAISAVLIKFAIEANSFAKILSYESWGLGLGGLVLYILFPKIRNAFLESIRTVRRIALGVMFINEGIYVFAKSISYYAISIGPVALVSVLGGVQVFYGILFGWVLTLIVPHLIKEDIGKTSLLKKCLSAIALFAGLWLIYK